MNYSINNSFFALLHRALSWACTQCIYLPCITNYISVCITNYISVCITNYISVCITNYISVLPTNICLYYQLHICLYYQLYICHCIFDAKPSPSICTSINFPVLSSNDISLRLTLKDQIKDQWDFEGIYIIIFHEADELGRMYCYISANGKSYEDSNLTAPLDLTWNDIERSCSGRASSTSHTFQRLIFRNKVVLGNLTVK